MSNQKQRYELVRGRRGMRELFPDIHETPHLVFFDEKGKVRAACYFGSKDFTAFDLGMVPDDVADQGAEAVTAYAEKRMHNLIEMEKCRRDDRSQRVYSLHREFLTVFDGVLIKGVLTKGPDNGARDNRLRLVMTEPFQLEDLLYVRPQCYADSVGGFRTFDDDGNLLDQEVKRTEEALLRMYKAELKRRNKPPAHPVFSTLPRSRCVREDD